MKRRKNWLIVQCVGVVMPMACFLFMSDPAAEAADLGCHGGALIVAVDGDVRVLSAAGVDRPARLDGVVCPGYRVMTGADGRVELRIEAAETVLGLDANAEIFVPHPVSGLQRAATGQPERVRIGLVSGALRFLSSVRSIFEVETRHATAGIDGTEAVVATDPEVTLVVVREGDVTLVPTTTGTSAATQVLAGQAAVVAAGDSAARLLTPSEISQLPRRLARLAADPAGASDWAIYYPPLILETAAENAAISAALRALAEGDAERAERRLDEGTAALSGSALADALALRSVIAISRGRAEDGDALARRAIATDAGAPSAQSALSFALQGDGQLEGARDAAVAAATLSPLDPFAAARVAELSLLIGDRRRAEAEARHALSLGDSSLAGAVLGLALLQADRQDAARQAFRSAIEADSEDPLPRLGLGLALMRTGEIAAGRREIETAAALSPRRAVFRTWLGRAYEGEGLPDKAGAQYELARDADPDDPLPWLLEAESLFRANRMVEAVRAVRAAETLGDRRATLRASAGLFEDAATRGAALGRLLEIAGFEDAALNAAAGAVESDPSNAAAHGVLADLTGKRERQELVRVSAGLADQVWRRPSTEPLDPSRQEIDLDLLDAGSATRPTLSEFGPYFDSDGARAVLSGAFGTQDTVLGTAAGAAMADGWSAAATISHAETDGYAVNNDVSHTLLAAEVRGQLLPDVTVFGAFGYRSTTQGDRTLSFNDVAQDPDVEEELERHYGRVGATWRINADHALAVVGTWTEQERDETNPDLSDLGRSIVFGDEDGRAIDVQAQHVGRFGPFSTVSGLSIARSDTAGSRGLDFGSFDFSVPLEQKTRHESGYLYATISFGTETGGEGRLVPSVFAGATLMGAPVSADLTLGVTVDRFRREIIEFDPLSDRDTTVSPKLGLRVDVGDFLTLRGGVMQAVAPDSLAPQRLEPQTVAGLTQLTDSPGGSQVTTWGGGIEIRPIPNVDFGIEGLKRTISAAPDDTLSDDANQSELRVHMDALLGERFTAGIAVERLTAAVPGFTLLDVRDYRVTEATARVGWFHPAGFFATARAGVARHRVEFGDMTGRDTFPITDLELGYRLPEGRGVVALEIRNATDSSVGFFDRPTLPNVTSTEPRFARDFTAIGRVTVGF
ncbi:MAG: FecR domain-containing protein [Pseudomonadota bacterium]